MTLSALYNYCSILLVSTNHLQSTGTKFVQAFAKEIIIKKLTFEENLKLRVQTNLKYKCVYNFTYIL